MYGGHLITAWNSKNGNEWVECIDGNSRTVHLEELPDGSRKRYITFKGDKAYVGLKPTMPKLPAAQWEKTRGYSSGHELKVGGLTIASVHYDATRPKGCKEHKWIANVNGVKVGQPYETDAEAMRAAEVYALKRFAHIYMALSRMEGTLE